MRGLAFIDKAFVAVAVLLAAALIVMVVAGRIGQPELTWVTSAMLVGGTMFNLWRGHI